MENHDETWGPESGQGINEGHVQIDDASDEAKWKGGRADKAKRDERPYTRQSVVDDCVQFSYDKLALDGGTGDGSGVDKSAED